ncbi:MAG: hypothetical protein CMK38_06960 [Porticoccaceae bacterium]|nr:hypothetical protein [Porticoccaceae bacterium]
MSDEDQPYTVNGSLGVGSNSEITFPAPNEDTYNQQYNVAATSNAVRVNSETNAGVTTTRFNLSELGLSQKEITLTFRKND